jgi:hypothetical protein
MKKLKCLSRGQSSGFSVHHRAARAAKFWLLTPEFGLLSSGKYFFRKTKPNFARLYWASLKKRTQIEPK